MDQEVSSPPVERGDEKEPMKFERTNQSGGASNFPKNLKWLVFR